jgi:hypothetical protein
LFSFWRGKTNDHHDRLAFRYCDPALGCHARGILANAVGPDAMRLVTHLDVDRAACVAAAEALTEEIEAA